MCYTRQLFVTLDNENHLCKMIYILLNSNILRTWANSYPNKGTVDLESASRVHVKENSITFWNGAFSSALWYFSHRRALQAHSTQSRAWGPKVKWVSSVTPRTLGVLFSGATSWWWSRDWWVSEVNSGTLDFWRALAISSHLPTSPKKSRVGSPSPPRCWEQRPATWSRRRNSE